VLDGKKKAKTKYSLIIDEYPMRGHLICPRCGKHLTGSSALGNGVSTIATTVRKGARCVIKTLLHTVLLNFGWGKFLLSL
jgi:hypothetical protein